MQKRKKETKNKGKINHKKHHATDIEVSIESILQELGLSYKKEYLVGNYPVDFHIEEYNLSIQADGCFHHGCVDCYNGVKLYPRQIFQRRRDKACILYHKYNKINIIRIRECDLKRDSLGVKNLIIEVIKKIKEGNQKK